MSGTKRASVGESAAVGVRGFSLIFAWLFLQESHYVPRRNLTEHFRRAFSVWSGQERRERTLRAPKGVYATMSVVDCPKLLVDLKTRQDNCSLYSGDLYKDLEM